MGTGDGADLPADASGDAPGRPARHRSRTREFVEWVAVIAGALAVALLIRTFLLGAFWIPSESMEPTLLRKDRVLVNKLSYRWGDIGRGDIVVFHRPPNEADTTIKDLIKRVVGLEGETIETRDGRVWINDQPLAEPYLRLAEVGCAGSDRPPIVRQVIPEDHVFVMGDNRCNSSDSRRFGPIDEDLVVGRAFVRMWPLGRFGGL